VRWSRNACDVICIYKDHNCVQECVGDDAYAMSHLSAVNLATVWLGTTRVDARVAAASMIYAAASSREGTLAPPAEYD